MQGHHYEECKLHLNSRGCTCEQIRRDREESHRIRRERIWQATLAIAGGMVARGLPEEFDPPYAISTAKELAEELVNDFWGKA